MTNRFLIQLDVNVEEGYFEGIASEEILSRLHNLLENDWPIEVSPSVVIQIPHRNDDWRV